MSSMVGMGEVEIREKLMAGMCPFCDRGPFHIVATHVSRIHEINKRELRDMAGLFYNTSITSPEYHETRSAWSKQNWEANHLSDVMGNKPGYTKELSVAAVRLYRVKAGGIADGVRAAAGRKAAATRVAARADLNAEIARLVIDTELTYVEIGRRVGVHPKTVRMAARRAGYVDDGRARYYRSKRGMYTQSLRAGHEATRKKFAAQGAELVAAYEAGATIEELAEGGGVTGKSVRVQLKKYGAAIPDGRKDPNRRRRTNYPTQPPWYCSTPGCDRQGVARKMCGMHYQRYLKARV